MKKIKKGVLKRVLPVIPATAMCLGMCTVMVNAADIPRSSRASISIPFNSDGTLDFSSVDLSEVKIENDGGSSGKSSSNQSTKTDSQDIDSSGMITEAQIKALVEKSGDSVVKTTSKPGKEVSITVNAVAQAPSGLRHDVTEDRRVIGRITIPANISVTESYDGKTIPLSISATGKKSTGIYNSFGKYFSNDIAPIVFGNGKPVYLSEKVKVAIADPMENASVKNIYGYSYDTTENIYNSIKLENIRRDENGYIHFETDYLGVIILSDGKLAKE